MAGLPPGSPPGPSHSLAHQRNLQSKLNERLPPAKALIERVEGLAGKLYRLHDDPQRLAAEWQQLPDEEQTRMVAQLCEDLEDPDCFQEAGDVLIAVLPVSSRTALIWAARWLHRLRTETAFPTARRNVLRILWDSGMLHDDYEKWMN
uniref:Uncharacterized protein n=1 Tax=Chromera velia CCMP2878 TaxID=1169474 RepID=A0A0G4FMH7_9ALVE|eukprot:Cvel_3525.t1-p1 / transcript=Cvel_3525.t1 / gene=Cvel_3525 / organism=Chromera_velia_CCMP2878 / gene_product=hypothetical protein / transcript_product=hypothetical protein / location=Cvel_scaffold143:78346-80658(-) / protein_length=147 / sequence_SO=supercontig / SO=protein_coding / is_pseudo=false